MGMAILFVASLSICVKSLSMLRVGELYFGMANENMTIRQRLE